MSPVAPVAPAVKEPLRVAVGRRSPAVLAALDVGQARARASAWATGPVIPGAIDEVRVRSVLYRPDGGATLRYLVRLAPSGREQVLLGAVPATGGDVVVRPFPADPGLPTLSRAVDPQLMRAVLGRVVPGTGGERAIGRCVVDVVHHPRQGPCVLRYRLSPGAGGAGELRHPVVFGKVYADAAAAVDAASALRLLGRVLRRPPDRLRVVVPEPLAVVDSLHLGLAAAIPGTPLLPGLLTAAGDGRGLTDAVRGAAALAAALHSGDTAGSRLPVRDLAGERAATERDLALLEPVWPELAAHLRCGVARAVDGAEGGDAGGDAGGGPAPVLAHGDLTPSQVLLGSPGSVGLVDVDTLCLAEPALDLGRFLAYLHVTALRRSRQAGPLLADLTELFLAAYGDTRAGSGGMPGDGDLRTRVAAYRALALARAGARACWQLKDERLDAILRSLDAGNDWTGSRTG
jgi:hypothetical protein